jgi:hypothetical protein
MHDQQIDAVEIGPGPAQKARTRLAQTAQPLLEEGESVKHVFLGQTFITPWVYLLVAPFVFVLVAKSRVVLLTDRHVYVLARRSGNRVGDVIAKLPLGAASVDLGKMSIKIGDTDRLWANGGPANMKLLAEQIRSHRAG